MKNSDFHTVYSEGKSKADSRIVMYVRKNGSDKNRLGISVSKKVGNSVVRHHLTRLIREIFRSHEGDLSTGLDLVIVVRVNGRSSDYHQLDSSFMHLARLLHILVKEY